MPEITEASKHIMVEETKQGLNIEIVDQDGRSMFPDGAKEPYERTRKIIQKIAPSLKAMPYRISITGHTASSKVPAEAGLRAWELSADRANAVRQILEAEGVPSGHIFMVAGKADTEPLFPDNPYMSPNRRVTITLMREEPPLPADLTPEWQYRGYPAGTALIAGKAPVFSGSWRCYKRPPSTSFGGPRPISMSDGVNETAASAEASHRAWRQGRAAKLSGLGARQRRRRLWRHRHQSALRLPRSGDRGEQQPAGRPAPSCSACCR